MKKIISIITILIFSFAEVSASTLEDIFKEFKEAKTVKLEFSQGDLNFTLYSQGSKYRLENKYINVLFDGENLYNYNVSTKELVIESLSDTTLLSNPVNLLSLSVDDFDCKKADKGYVITPKNVESMGVKSIALEIVNNKIKSIDVLTLNDEQFAIEILSQELNVEMSPKDFTFNKRNYPSAEIIDFR